MDANSKGDENDRNKVKVLTAGGAAASSSSSSPSRKKRNRRRKKGNGTPKSPPEAAVAVAVASQVPPPVAASEPKHVAATPSIVSTPSTPADDSKPEAQNTPDAAHSVPVMSLEFEEPSSREQDDWDFAVNDDEDEKDVHKTPYADDPKLGSSMNTTSTTFSSQLDTTTPNPNELVWLIICFLGIMASFVCYGLLLEYTTSGGRNLHELSFLFVTSGLYTLTAAAGRYVRDETPTTIPPARFAILGLTSMGSTFCSVRSLRYVIYPIQVLAKSCKPVPVMLMGALMGKKYARRKYFNVVLIVLGVALFMGAGNKSKKASSSSSSSTGSEEATADDTSSSSSPSQLIGIVLLFVSLCFDGGTGAYEDKLMSVHSVQPFDLMYNIQLGKTILAGVGLLIFNQLHIFLQMVHDMGFLLVALGLSGAMGQIFIFVTISKFGALTCSIIGLSRKVTTLVASIYFYGHHLNGLQFTGLMISVTAMVLNFMGKKKGGEGGHGGGGGGPVPTVVPEEMEKMLEDEPAEDDGDVELATAKLV